METIYDWLLHNTGNEGNYYTILNTQRNAIGNLGVMARTSDFDVVNLLIEHTERTEQVTTNSTEKSGADEAECYIFDGEQQVVDFLAEGKILESQTSDAKNGIRVFVTEPAGKAGDVTFPPAQA